MNRRLRLLLVGRLMAGHPRRWMYYTLAMVVWRRVRHLLGRQPEVVYRARLAPGGRVDMLTARPLPRRFQTRRRRRWLAAAALEELRRTR